MVLFFIQYINTALWWVENPLLLCMASGFLFAFKMYVPNKDPDLDIIENMVHHLTRSDLIHVEIIPILGGHYLPVLANEGGMQAQYCLDPVSVLVASNVAHTAYVGMGYNEHCSAYCIDDCSYTHLFVPLPPEQTMAGLSFLKSLQGKHYNYLALPFTILPKTCKFKLIARLQHCLNEPKKVFCSQIGLMLCYLCSILQPEYHYHGKYVVLDPMCCTPADLYHLLVSNQQCHAFYCKPEQIRIQSSPPLSIPLCVDEST